MSEVKSEQISLVLGQSELPKLFLFSFFSIYFYFLKADETKYDLFIKFFKPEIYIQNNYRINQ